MQILTEVAGETLSQMAAAPRTKLAQKQAQVQEEEEQQQDSEDEQLAARLKAIRN